MVEKVSGTDHLVGCLSYSLKRPGFGASESQVDSFYDTHLPDVDTEALQDLDDGTTLLVVSPFVSRYCEVDAALKALRTFFEEKEMDITVRFAALAQGESQTSKALLQRRLDADLKPQIVQDLADAVKLEREEHGSAATAIGQFWVIIYAIFCREYVYVGSAGTRKVSSKAKGEDLVKACNDLKAEKFLTAARALLKHRMNGHQGDLTEGSKNDSWKTLFGHLKREHGDNVHVGEIVIPVFAFLGHVDETKDEVVRDYGLNLEDQGIDIISELHERVRRRRRRPSRGRT